jgi:hypothetical protein
MSKGAYTYEPGNITEFGKDRMRFELGDTMVEGLADTTALTDEEIQAAIDAYPNKWKRAKLMLLESLCRRFAYEVNTKTGPLSLDMNGRAKLWKEDYDKLEKRGPGRVSVSATVWKWGRWSALLPYRNARKREGVERMINARFMYLRPGNLFKDFVVESNTQVVTASGRVANAPKGDGSKIIRGCLAESTKEQKESHSTRDRVCTHTIVQAGSPEAKKSDKLILGNRTF